MNEKDFLQKFFKVYKINNFTEYYNTLDVGVDVNTFLKCKFDVMLGVLLQYVAVTNKIAINADAYSYCIYPVAGISDIKPVNLLNHITSFKDNSYLDIHSSNDNILSNYKSAFILILEIIGSKPY